MDGLRDRDDVGEADVDRAMPQDRVAESERNRDDRDLQILHPGRLDIERVRNDVEDHAAEADDHRARRPQRALAIGPARGDRTDDERNDHHRHDRVDHVL